MSDESIKTPSAHNNIFNPSLDYLGTKTRVKFNANCLKQDNITFNHKTIINVYTVYKINKNFPIIFPAIQHYKIVCLEQLVRLKTLMILMRTNISDMTLDLIEKELFQKVMDLVEVT